MDTRPLLLYDGTCGFCCFWIARWRRMTGERIGYAPSQLVRQQFPQIEAEAYARGVQLVRPDGTVASGAEAVFETLGWRATYVSVPGLGWLAEKAYGMVARHRPFFYKLTLLVFGRDGDGGSDVPANPCARL